MTHTSHSVEYTGGAHVRKTPARKLLGCRDVWLGETARSTAPTT